MSEHGGRHQQPHRPTADRDGHRQPSDIFAIGHQRRRRFALRRLLDLYAAHSLPIKQSSAEQPPVIRIRYRTHNLQEGGNPVQPDQVEQAIVEQRIRRQLDAAANITLVGYGQQGAGNSALIHASIFQNRPHMVSIWSYMHDLSEHRDEVAQRSIRQR